jgi:esterase/lipase superfamily enzyme
MHRIDSDDEAREQRLNPSAGSLQSRIFRIGLVLLAASSLGACAGYSRGFLAPVVESAPGTSKVDLLVATTRMPAGSTAEMFSGGRGSAPAFADIEVSLPPDAAREIGEVQWPRQVPGNPAVDFVTLRAEIIDRAQAIATFHKRIAKTPGRQVLVFIHGFNNRFEDAVFRFAQIVHDSDAEVTPVLFTWPSRGSLLAYGYDRESTNYSRNALEDLLRWLAKDPQVGEISILAHSMGNWLALESLRQMAIRDGHIAPKIRNVLLAAPDVDVDLAREQIADMGPNRPNFTLFVSQNDKALVLSERIWGGTRLGAIDPAEEPYKTDLARENIKVVDLTNIRSADVLNHNTFAESPKIVELIGARLAQGQTITDSHEGIGDRIIERATGAAASVGAATALVVSAPVAVVDPSTRENYADEVQALGQSVHKTVQP